MSSDKEEASYLTQIQYLEEQLDSWRPKQEQIEKEYKELVSQFAQVQEDSKIHNGHLKRVLTANEKRATELLDQLENKPQDAKRHREELKLQHSKEMQEMCELIEKLKSENKMEAEKLEQQKKDLISVKSWLSAMESLWKQLDKQEEEQDELEEDFIKIIQQKCILKKKVDELIEQCQQLTSKLEDCMLAKQQTLAKTKDLSKRLYLVHECHPQSARITSLLAEIQKERRKNLKLEGVKQEAAMIVRHLLSEPENLSENQSKVQKLLEILESTALL